MKTIFLSTALWALVQAGFAEGEPGSSGNYVEQLLGGGETTDKPDSPQTASTLPPAQSFPSAQIKDTVGSSSLVQPPKVTDPVDLPATSSPPVAPAPPPAPPPVLSVAPTQPKPAVQFPVVVPQQPTLLQQNVAAPIPAVSPPMGTEKKTSGNGLVVLAVLFLLVVGGAVIVVKAITPKKKIKAEVEEEGLPSEQDEEDADPDAPGDKFEEGEHAQSAAQETASADGGDSGVGAISVKPAMPVALPEAPVARRTSDAEARDFVPGPAAQQFLVQVEQRFRDVLVSALSDQKHRYEEIIGRQDALLGKLADELAGVRQGVELALSSKGSDAHNNSLQLLVDGQAQIQREISALKTGHPLLTSTADFDTSELAALARDLPPGSKAEELLREMISPSPTEHNASSSP